MQEHKRVLDPLKEAPNRPLEARGDSAPGEPHEKASLIWVEPGKLKAPF